MADHNKINLTTIPAPKAGSSFDSAPPILNASDHTTDFSCGKCGTILMHAEINQVYGLTIRCENSERSTQRMHNHALCYHGHGPRKASHIPAFVSSGGRQEGCAAF